MTEPRRLLDDPTNGDRLRRDLSIAAGDGPVQVDLGKAIAAFDAALVIGAVGVAASAQAAGVAVTKLGSWVAAASLTVAVGVGGGVAYVKLRAPDRQPPAVVARAQPRFIPQPHIEPMMAAPVVAPPAPETHPKRLASRPSMRPAPVAVPPVQAVAPAPPVPVDDATIRREVGHVALMRRELDRAPLRVLTLADQARVQFPRGVLTEEREALAVLALDKLGRADEARVRARAFLQRFARGSFTERIRRIAAP